MSRKGFQSPPAIAPAPMQPMQPPRPPMIAKAPPKPAMVAKPAHPTKSRAGHARQAPVEHPGSHAAFESLGHD